MYFPVIYTGFILIMSLEPIYFPFPSTDTRYIPYGDDVRDTFSPYDIRTLIDRALLALIFSNGYFQFPLVCSLG
jgi:hypothetical protein